MKERPVRFVTPIPEPPRWWQLLKRFRWRRFRRVGRFEETVLPLYLARPVYPKLIPEDIVPIQPMDELNPIPFYFNKDYDGPGHKDCPGCEVCAPFEDNLP